ncbi:nidogen-1-like, partial [Sinocyclocheilus grahami]|uniref:nidogen-1-like n=1 Tax=Sinocyclocheilus grahami TaxID=75366 RepID=UPI0007AD5B8D
MALLRSVGLLALLVSVRCLNREQLFDYGIRFGDKILDSGTDSVRELELEQTLFFFKGKFDKVHVNTNGFISLTNPTDESEYLGKMPASFGMIAAFLGDLDTTDGAGYVYFRQDKSPDVLQRAAEHIGQAFPSDDEIEPTHAIIVTWENVAPQGERGTGGEYAVNTNGFISLTNPTDESEYLGKMPASFGMIAAFLGDLDTTDGAGYVYFRQDKSPDVLQRAAEHIGQAFPSDDEIEPTHAIIVTWENVAPQGERGTGGEYARNTFQLVVANMESASYAILLYPEESMQFGSTLIDDEDQLVEVGFNEGKVLIIDEDELNVDVFSYNNETCSSNKNKCSVFADCRDYADGFCCRCKPGYYGNGKDCVAEGKPQRMNGKVSGRIYVGGSPSPVEFSNNDLHSYVVTNDGRAYIAISSIPSSVGPSLQPLLALGEAIGWAFALQQPDYHNGFSSIGGVFTRQAEVVFQPGNERLSVRQEFGGIDEHDHLLISTELDGRIPEVPRGATVQIEPYSEIYQHSSNLITSSSQRDYIVSMPDGSVRTHSFLWTQSIKFQSCPHEEVLSAVPASQQLSVDQIFVMYDSSNQLIRFAMSNKIGSIHSGIPEQNPCFTGRHGCDTNAVCRAAQGKDFTCECAAGFTGDGRVCYGSDPLVYILDIDECQPGRCHSDAICHNTQGSFTCQCRPGFHGDGFSCTPGS